MPKNSIDATNAKKEEIITALEELYKTKSFKELTIKEISHSLPFGRTSIYTYFQTKEEIFLLLNKREYDRWIEDLNSITANHATLKKKELADLIAKSLAKRENLLKLMSMNHFEMEANSRDEILVEFKTSFGKALKTVSALMKKYCPDLNTENFIYTFFPFIYGIYPYAAVVERQINAMEKAGVAFSYHTIYELAYLGTINLLKNSKND